MHLDLVAYELPVCPGLTQDHLLGNTMETAVRGVCHLHETKNMVPAPEVPTFLTPTVRTNKDVRPTKLHQIRHTRFFCREAMCELDDIAGEGVTHPSE